MRATSLFIIGWSFSWIRLGFSLSARKREKNFTTQRALSQASMTLAENEREQIVYSDPRALLVERFFRAHESTGADIEGTGLGLSIVRDTIESLGGRVWAEFPGDGRPSPLPLPVAESWTQRRGALKATARVV